MTIGAAALDDAEPSWGFLVWRLRALLPILLLAGFGGGLLAPNLLYMGLNFFAREHTRLPAAEIHCELTPAEDYCRSAIAENTAWWAFLGSVASLVKFLAAPALGCISDAYGRRRLLLCLAALGLLPGVACVLHVYGCVSLYWVFALSLLSDLPTDSVFLAACTDLLADYPKGRASAFGLVAGSLEFSTLVGLAVGSQMELRHAVAAAILADCCSLLAMILLLPETLQVVRRPASLHRPALLPGTGMTILVRDHIFQCLSFCVVASAFVSAGLGQVAAGFFQASMAWTREMGIQMAMVTQVSAIVWLGAGMHCIMSCFGELGVLGVSFIAIACWAICIPLCASPGQVLILVACFAGPSALSFPAISALKSQLADEHEQGELQGALHAAIMAASVAGTACFGGLFSRLLAQEGIHAASLVFAAGGVAMVGPLAVVCSCLPGLLRHRRSLCEPLLGKP
eukprot:TRINITY_DN93061_c0_g1_i1.p1 TRINITY_DN93061_c0_g1~~TRINITY_DN93061_c0_g1_i1.p1  ORF type:complete len:456 (-),score=74.37 TRINITY_DN93061_c0_g1_i1:24-1391(-)